MDRKDTNLADSMLYAIMRDCCTKCRAAVPGIDCVRCRSRRYYNKLLKIVKPETKESK